MDSQAERKRKGDEVEKEEGVGGLRFRLLLSHNDAITAQAAHWADSHEMDRNPTNQSSTALKDKTQEGQ